MLKRGKKYQAITQHNYMKNFLNLIIKNLWKLNQMYFIFQKKKNNNNNSHLTYRLSYNDIFVVHIYNITNNKNKNEK